MFAWQDLNFDTIKALMEDSRLTSISHGVWVMCTTLQKIDIYKSIEQDMN